MDRSVSASSLEHLICKLFGCCGLCDNEVLLFHKIITPTIRIPRKRRKRKTETTIPITGPAWRPVTVSFRVTIGVGVVLEPQIVVGSGVVLLSLEPALRHCVGSTGSEVKSIITLSRMKK